MGCSSIRTTTAIRAAHRSRQPLTSDGVLEDPDVEYQRRVQMVRDGLLKPSLFLAWYFDCSEEKAAQMMPERQDDGGLFSGGEI